MTDIAAEMREMVDVLEYELSEPLRDSRKARQALKRLRVLADLEERCRTWKPVELEPS